MKELIRKLIIYWRLRPIIGKYKVFFANGNAQMGVKCVLEGETIFCVDTENRKLKDILSNIDDFIGTDKASMVKRRNKLEKDYH